MLKINQLNFGYFTEKEVLKDLTFSVEKGEILTILGESGSGKSSLLKLIYGLEDAVSGEIYYKNKAVKGPKFNLVPGHPKMKFVPQEFDLLDSIRVKENVGKYLSNFNLPLKEKQILKAISTVDLLQFKDELPSNLSGGQRQRVAIARALAAKPEVLLLDEPYSHLDNPLKHKIRKSIWNWAKKNQLTLILTTHDINDALGYSDRIMVLQDGKIIQLDSPENLKKNPVNEYVASILGDYSILSSKQLEVHFGKQIPNRSKAIVYPEAVFESENGIEFEVVDVRFRGRDFLVEAKREDVKLSFFTDKSILKEQVKLGIRTYSVIKK